MAGNPIKFRCYQCNQLLGVSRSKVGLTVSCPKCAADLIVPDPDEGPESSSPPSALESIALGDPAASDTTPAFLSSLAAGLPYEIADIRPEDIRAEPGITLSPSPPSPPPP